MSGVEGRSKGTEVPVALRLLHGSSAEAEISATSGGDGGRLAITVPASVSAIKETSSISALASGSTIEPPSPSDLFRDNISKKLSSGKSLVNTGPLVDMWIRLEKAFCTEISG